MAQSGQCNNHPRRVLVADDDDVFRERLARALRERGWDVCSARTANEAAELVRCQQLDYALVDLGMTDASGLEVLGTLRALRRVRSNCISRPRVTESPARALPSCGRSRRT
jgi:ActR/RegA family two-component response regulator